MMWKEIKVRKIKSMKKLEREGEINVKKIKNTGCGEGEAKSEKRKVRSDRNRTGKDEGKVTLGRN
jgi:hypothetical protein